MGKQSGANAVKFSGRMGNTVGYMWRGQWCIRALPGQFHDARTERQLNQRALFKASVKFAGMVNDVLRVGFRVPALAVHKTECNYFLMRNKDCLSWDGEELVVNYEGLRVSEGPVAPVAFGVPQVDDMGTMVTLAFEKNPQHRLALADDKVYLAALRADTGEAMLSVPAYRHMKRVSIVLPDEWAGIEVHLYGFVQDIAGRTSDSLYIGRVPTADESIATEVDNILTVMDVTTKSTGSDGTGDSSEMMSGDGQGGDFTKDVFPHSSTAARGGPPPLD